MTLARLALAGALALAMTGAAAAQDGADWSGFSIGVGGGVGILDAEVSGTGTRNGDIGICDPTNCAPTFIPIAGLGQTTGIDLNGVGGAGAIGTLQVAYDHQLGNNMVAGVFLDADLASDVSGTASTASSLDINILGGLLAIPLSDVTASADVKENWSLTLGGRLGLLANQSTLLYVLAGYNHTELDGSLNYTVSDPLGLVLAAANAPTNLTVDLPDSLNGYTLGAGAQSKIGGPFSLKFEYRFTHLEGEADSAAATTVQCCIGPIGRRVTEALDAGIEADVHSARAVLSYDLN